MLISVVSLISFLSATTYISCYVMSFEVKDNYMDLQFASLPEYQQEQVMRGDLIIENMNPTPEFMQDAGYNYCLSFAPGLPEVINVEFESDEQ